MKLYPLIEQDGTIGELTLGNHDTNKIYRRAKPINRYLTRHYAEPTDANIDYDTFQSRICAFHMEIGKSAMVTIFVHTEFLSHLNNFDRGRAIDKHINANAAWLFTYGERIKYD